MRTVHRIVRDILIRRRQQLAAVRHCHLAWLLATLSIAAPGVALAEAPKVPFANRPISAVLSDYVSRGYPLIFSSDLIRGALRFQTEPAPGAELDRLKTALAGEGFDLQLNDELSAWLVVAAPPVETRKPLAATTAAMTRRSRQPDLEELLVTSSRYVLASQASQLSHRSLQGAQIEKLPELGEDALRVVTQLPGMASQGVSARPHIRGGMEDETLVIFNTMELIEPFHLRDFQSLFSTLNPRVVKRIDVYTGGFPARYGDRMSGVLDITPADDYPELGGEINLSVLTTALTGYGNDSRGHWVVAGRRGNLDWLTRTVNSDVGRPSYADVFAQRTVQLSPASDLDVGLLGYQDDILLRDEETDPQTGLRTGEHATASSINVYGWIKANHAWSDTLDSSAILSYARIRQKRGGTSSDGAADEANGALRDNRRMRILNLNVGFDQWLGDNTALQYGLQVTRQAGRFDYAAYAETGDLAVLLNTPDIIDRELFATHKGINGSAYLSALFSIGERLHVEAGLRANYFSLTPRAKWRMAPRLNVQYSVSEAWQTSLAAGRFYQNESIADLPIADGITEFQTPQYADHFIVGVQFAPPASGLSTRLEAYYKRFGNPKTRFENLFNPIVMLPEIKPDRVRIDPDDGYAAGVELSLSYTPNDQFSTWFVYGASKVLDRVGGVDRPRAWDQRHSASAGFTWTGARYDLSLAVHWQSGWQNTELPLVLDSLEPLPLRHNRQELRDYLSIDLRASRTWQWTNQSLNVYLEIVNLTDRWNIGGLQHEFEEGEDGRQYRATDERTLLPLVPSVGLLWKFRRYVTSGD
ncbi:MAG: TonB-dependent receptor [Pseudomonadales bacterium]|nr:TonB-dependent receptor [Pseudomonadales bacterium]